MIFATWAYYLFFLVPRTILFRLSPLRYRPWVIVAGGSSFFLIFPTQSQAELFLRRVWEFFLWESIISRFYRPKSWWKSTQAIVGLFICKY